MAAAAILDFPKVHNLNGLSAVWDQCASLCQISSKSAKQLQRHHDLTFFFKMAAVCHLEFAGHIFGPPMMSTWWSLSLCEI